MQRNSNNKSIEPSWSSMHSTVWPPGVWFGGTAGWIIYVCMFVLFPLELVYLFGEDQVRIYALLYMP